MPAGLICRTEGGASKKPPRRVEVLEKKRLFEGFLSLDQAVVRYERFDGTMSEPVTRLSVERGDAVGVLLFDPGRDQVALVEQFRYPVYAAGDPGWLLEIVAGTVPRGEDPQAVARAEVREEAGYEAGELQPLGTCYLSPGGSSERVHLFVAHVSIDERASAGGGVAGEGEDTRLCILGRAEALRLLREGGIVDAKTMVALQALFCMGESIGKDAAA